MPTLTPNQQQKPRTPGFVQKPRPTPAEISRKREKPAGYCVAAAQQKARIIRNKAMQESAGRKKKGGGGFPGAKGFTTDFLTSPEGAMLISFFLVFMEAVRGIFRTALAAAFGGVFARAENTGDRLERIPATVPATPRLEHDATPAQRPQRRAPPRPGTGGGGGDGGAGGPARRPNQNINIVRDERRSESFQRGYRLREAAERDFGDAGIYALVAAIISYKPGQRDNPRDTNPWGRLAKLHPDLPEWLKETSPVSLEMRELRKRMEAVAARQGGSTFGADRSDVGAAMLPDLIRHAEAWRAANPPDFTAAGPKPEAEASGGVDHVAGGHPKPGAAPDDEPEYTLPKPKGF